MLQDLPIECLQQVIGYLPSATAVANLALTNRTLHAKISADNYGVLQYFVQRSFPTTKADLPWRESAIALTSRSRAWTKRAVVARECHPPNFEAVSRSEIRGKQKLGYVPAIDSYEITHDSSIAQRKEVVAWAAGGKINVKTTTSDFITWQTVRFPQDHEPSNDILELRLLRPHQHHASEGQSLIFRRANGEVTSVTAMNGTNDYSKRLDFHVGDIPGDCMDVSSAREPVLALCSSQSIRLYQIREDTGIVEPSEDFELHQRHDILNRQRCARFMSSDLLAVAPQYLQSRQPAPINLYDVNATRVLDRGFIPTAVLLPSDLSPNRHGANVLAPLDKVCGNDGQLFLYGCSDGVVRLHDTRTGNGSEISYTDKVDDGQILSLQAVGHESLLAGSHQNACLKTFDMRMPGARSYSYLHAGAPPTVRSTSQPKSHDVKPTQRDINIFLALKLPHRQAGWNPLPLNDPNTDRYRGSIYSLSAPSPSSPTVYAGIEDHVIQLDFVSTDDIRKGTPVDPIRHLDKQNPVGVFDLSCYERPREGFESTDAVLLRKQARFRDVLSHRHSHREVVGWDERWHVATINAPRGHGQRRQSWGRATRR